MRGFSNLQLSPEEASEQEKTLGLQIKMYLQSNSIAPEAQEVQPAVKNTKNGNDKVRISRKENMDNLGKDLHKIRVSKTEMYTRQMEQC